MPPKMNGRRKSGGYLNERALVGLKDYTYKPAGYTPMDYWHTPHWNWIAERLPLWLAPNLITLAGLLALVLAYAVNAWYLPEFEGPAPRWLYLLSASCSFFYLHMDCLDGKQARRTGTSSPLGQLFDHGCDALAVMLLIGPLASSFNSPFDRRAVLTTFAVQVLWILAHWEEYHTGVMLYGTGWYGVTEANYSVFAVHLVTATFGSGAWHVHPLKPLAPYLEAVLPAGVAQYLAGRELFDLAAVAIVYLAAANCLPQLHRVFRLSGTKQLEHTTLPLKERGHKTLGRLPALRHLAEVSVIFLLGGALVLLPAPAPYQSRLQVCTFGVMYALQATRLIMAHMCKEPFRIAVWPMVAIALQVGNVWLGTPLDPLLVAYAVNAAVVGGYLHYVVNVVQEICAYLDIPALTIRKKPLKRDE